VSGSPVWATHLATDLLVTQQRAVLLTDDPDRGMSLICSAAAALGGDWQLLDAIPARFAIWTGRLAYSGAARARISLAVTPLTLAYASKYRTACQFNEYEPIIVNFDSLTRNHDSHAWTYFAPVLRRATQVLALGALPDLVRLRPLIELVHHIDQCVIDAPGHDSGRLA